MRRRSADADKGKTIERTLKSTVSKYLGATALSAVLTGCAANTMELKVFGENIMAEANVSIVLKHADKKGLLMDVYSYDKAGELVVEEVELKYNDEVKEIGGKLKIKADKEGNKIEVIIIEESDIENESEDPCKMYRFGPIYDV